MKIAVVLMNLGGPDKLENVKPFLFNLFSDKAIINLPNPFRYMIAKLISNTREKKAKGIYASIGNKSPIVENTQIQADLLEKSLISKNDKNQYKCFIAMRYWKPFSYEIMSDINNFSPDQIILLPLYPQFSTTTTESSIKDFMDNMKGKNYKVKKICCFPADEKFIDAHIDVMSKYIENAIKECGAENIRILFSAHSLPEKIIKMGDGYQKQVELSTKLVIEKLKEKYKDLEKSEFINTYQSKVGPVKWIGPMTDEEIEKAGKDSKSVILIPISFVSEHSETLAELDIDYKNLSIESGVKKYYRVPTLSDNSKFIDCLSDIVVNLSSGDKNMYPYKRICEKEYCRCINENM